MKCNILLQLFTKKRLESYIYIILLYTNMLNIN